MKSLLKSTALLIFITLLYAFTQKEKNFTIEGEISGFPNGTKFYLRNLSTESIIDSTTIENNHFKFEGHLTNTPEQIWLHSTFDKKFYYTNLLIGNDNITVKGDIKDFPWNLTIKGSKTQDDFNYSQSIIKKYNIKRDSLVKFVMKLPQDKQNEQGRSIWKEIEKLDKTKDSLRIDYIKSHPKTFASIIELGYLKTKLPKDTIQKIFERYSPEIKKSKYATIVNVFLKENISKIGDKYHDFEGLNQNDKKVKFSDIREKYTLIDFTAAYCGPCMQAADELTRINNSYSNSLTLVSFSGDANKTDWLKSVERDNVKWTTIWDSKGRYSETSIKYGIQGFPTFVLINPEGIIIDKWTGYGKNSIIKHLEKNKINKK